MFTDLVPAWTQKVLGLLAPIIPPGSYLAGGTALALHLNHRSSYDLDVYVPEEFSEQLLAKALEENIPDFSLIIRDAQTLIGKSQDTEVSIFHYPYPLLEPLAHFQGMAVASVTDLACMKLEAVAGRGLKRDFFDLYTICQLPEWTLSKVVILTQRKYGRSSDELPHLLKSLSYFDDAESKPERAKIVDEMWRQVKEFFSVQARQLTQELLMKAE